MIFISLIACRTSLSTTLEDTGYDSHASLSEEVDYDLFLETKPHHWINTPIFIDSLIQVKTDALSETEVNWNYQWSCSNGTTGIEPHLTFTPTTVGIVNCTLIVQDTVTMLSETATISTEVHAAPDNADWTILVYLAGDNNLEESAIIDLNEMERIGSTEAVNIVVELDRSEQFYRGHENWVGAKRFYVTKDANEEEVDSESNKIVSVEMESLGSVDTGQPNTLTNFLTWGVETFPSEKIAIIFWNHGWSWAFQPSQSRHKGIMSDDATGNDISIAQGEFEEILQQVVEQRGQRIDILGLDACIMQSWEVATVSFPYADLLVASQDYVNWEGWAYDKFIGELVDDASMSPLELATSINRTFWQSGDSTISTINLNYLSEFNLQLDLLSQELISTELPSIVPIAPQTYSSDGDGGQDHDLFGILSILHSSGHTEAIKNHAMNLLSLKDTLIPDNFIGDWINGANGLSIHAPPSTDWELDETYLTASWSLDTLWDDVLIKELQENDTNTEE